MEKGKSSKVALVDDDSSMQAVLRTLLEIEGFQVVVIPDRMNLEEIIVEIRKEKPDVLLLDVHLRKTNGFDVVQQVRGDIDIGNMRVVMSSGMDLKDRCMASGANDFLMKPYMPDELIQKLYGEI